jgi:hypothetical protein
VGKGEEEWFVADADEVPDILAGSVIETVDLNPDGRWLMLDLSTGVTLRIVASDTSFIFERKP